MDAVFANRWQGHGVDYGEDSRRRFRDFSGFDLPLTSDANDPAWQAWTHWRRKVLTDVIAQWDDAVKAIRPNASFIPNMSGASLMEFDLSVITKHCPFLVVDHQGRRGVEMGWSAGRNGKRIRATFPDRPGRADHLDRPGGGIPVEGRRHLRRGDPALDQQRDRRTVCSPGSPNSTAWCRTRAGCSRWRTRSGCRRRSSRCSRRRRRRPRSPSSTPRRPCGIGRPKIRHKAEKHDLGFYHALVEARLPFELLSDQALTPEKLGRFKLIVLANVVVPVGRAMRCHPRLCRRTAAASSRPTRRR